jgi:hypothetical protein
MKKIYINLDKINELQVNESTIRTNIRIKWNKDETGFTLKYGRFTYIGHFNSVDAFDVDYPNYMIDRKTNIVIRRPYLLISYSDNRTFELSCDTVKECEEAAQRIINREGEAIINNQYLMLEGKNIYYI